MINSKKNGKPLKLKIMVELKVNERENHKENTKKITHRSFESERIQMRI